MLNSLKLMTFRVVLIAFAGAFVSIGPYLHYEHQNKLSVEPPIIDDSLVAFPDFTSIRDINEKKAAFFDYLRPKIELENQRITKERAFLTSLQKLNVTKEQKSYAERLASLYSYPLTDEQVTQAWLDEMLKRVNVLPEALVATQAANESAWGTSRFATQANNLFGQWCYTKDCGLVPEKRTVGRTHEVRKFNTVQESVHGYYMNLNRHRSYAEFRDIRANLAQEQKDLLSVEVASELTHGLHPYSERGSAYVNELRVMIRHNHAYWTQ